MKNSILFAFLVVFSLFKIGENFTINCDFGTYSLLVIGDVYACASVNIPISSGNRVTGVTGTHLSGKTNEDVEHISIQGTWTLSFVPQGFSNFFPNIKAIRFCETFFDILYGDELDEFPKLQSLSIYQSNLTTISSKLFEKTPKLVFIAFQNTMLQRVGYNLFTPLNVAQLIWVRFTVNRCINKIEQNGNQAAINLIINELHRSCPFDDEISTITAITTTTQGLTCSGRKIEDLVCDLKDEIERVQENFAAKDVKIKNLETELTKIREEMKAKEEVFELKIKWLEEDLQRVSTNRCTYK